MAVHYTSGPAFWLVLYFFFNLSLTLYNKSVLIRFPFPYTLTALHALCSATGSYIAKNRGYFTPANVSPRQNVMLIAFSVLYTINIAVSNQSLQMVTIPFHQVVRSTTPLFAIVLSSIILRTRFTVRKLISLIPVVAGVAIATYGDYHFTVAGLLLTLLGTVLAALKTICTNLLQVPPTPPQKASLGTPVTASSANAGWNAFRLQNKLHPLDLLLRMSPLAFIQCVLYAQASGELDRVRAFSATNMTRANLLALIVNGMIAFGLNVVSFTANKKTGALTMTVAANVKQVLTILLSMLIFNLSLTGQNATGITLTLFGGAWYGYIEYKEKTRGLAAANGGANGGVIPQWKHDGLETYYDKHSRTNVGWTRKLGSEWYRQLLQFLRTSSQKDHPRDTYGHGHGSDEEGLTMSPPPPPYSHLNSNSTWTTS